MEHMAPLGNIYQAGTLSGNPLAMTAGLETLKQLTPESYDHFNKLGDMLETGLKETFKGKGYPVTVNRAGSMIGFFLTEGPVTDFDSANTSDTDLFAKMYRNLLEEGVYLPPSQFEGMFLSTKHTEDDIRKTLAAFSNALEKIKAE